MVGTQKEKNKQTIIAFFILILVTVIILAVLQLRGQFRANKISKLI